MKYDENGNFDLTDRQAFWLGLVMLFAPLWGTILVEGIFALIKF